MANIAVYPWLEKGKKDSLQGCFYKRFEIISQLLVR